MVIAIITYGYKYNNHICKLDDYGIVSTYCYDFCINYGHNYGYTYGCGYIYGYGYLLLFSHDNLLLLSLSQLTR